MLNIFFLVSLIIILIILKTNESFLARPYLVLKHMDKQTFDPVGGNPEERKPLNLALLHKVKKCYDTRNKNYYDCVARLPLKLTPRRRKIKKKTYVNYIKSGDTKHLFPQSFK